MRELRCENLPCAFILADVRKKPANLAILRRCDWPMIALLLGTTRGAIWEPSKEEERLLSVLFPCIYIGMLLPRLFYLFAGLSTVCGLLSAQTSSPMAAGPTTRVLAVGHITAGTSREKVMPVMQKEVRDTVRLYLSGKLDQWFVRRDQNGVVFLLNVASVDEARELLEKLPLGQAKLMEFDLIPLGPLSPLGLLLQEPGATPK